MTYLRITAAMCVCCLVMTVLFLIPGLAGLIPDFERLFAAHVEGFSAAFCVLMALIVYTMGVFLYPRLCDWLEDLTLQSNAALQEASKAMSGNTLSAAIIVTSAATLFLELVLIRWQASLFPVFALYKNFTMLACFCGLGIGYALSRKPPLYLPAVLPALASTIMMLMSLRYTGASGARDVLFYVPVREETSVFAFTPAVPNSVSWIFDNIPIYLLLIGTFILNTLIMVPVAQFCGHLMGRVKPLAGYGCNLLGSIAGVSLLFLLSALWIGPVIWFGIAAALILWYLVPVAAARRAAMCCAIACIVVTALPVDPMTQNIYSPYQLIQKTSKHDGLMEILSAGSYYQRVYNLSLSNLNRDDAELRPIVGYYELPFRTAGRLDRVAIVGAGSGNDVAAALRAGAKAVDGVEIDPAIIQLGRLNHPEHPYDDARVTVINDDARTFFRNTSSHYDAIVYGVLDSHILLSHGSNVRLDSFVYTQEGLREAYNHLNDGGLMSVSFALPNARTGIKICRMLAALPGAGHPAAVFAGSLLRNITTFMVRKGGEITLPQKFLGAHGLAESTKGYADDARQSLDLPVDDWPFFYMDARMYPTSYVVALVLVMALAVMLMRALLPGQYWDKSLLPFFFLGGGFMLVETKAITELGLLFGNTWHVIGITIIGVLVMAFFANLFVTYVPVRKVALPYALLLAAIGLGYAVALHGGLPEAGWITKLGMVALLTSPLLFSGMVFSSLLKKAPDLSSALAYNLTGAMLGGLLEYNSMEFGFAFLYVLAFALYALAWASGRLKDAH